MVGLRARSIPAAPPTAGPTQTARPAQAAASTTRRILLAGLVSQADLAVFPVSRVGHEAGWPLKRHCEAGGKPYHPVRSASLGSFAHAVMPPPAS